MKSGVPVYRQLIDQVLIAIASGQVGSGDQLPTVRQLAVDLSINPNTVVRAYRELQHEGVIELRHGSGAYISESMPSSARITRKDRTLVESAVERLAAAGLSEDEIRRLFEHALSSLRHGASKGGNHA